MQRLEKSVKAIHSYALVLRGGQGGGGLLALLFCPKSSGSGDYPDLQKRQQTGLPPKTGIL